VKKSQKDKFDGVVKTVAEYEYVRQPPIEVLRSAVCDIDQARIRLGALETIIRQTLKAQTQMDQFEGVLHCVADAVNQIHDLIDRAQYAIQTGALEEE